MNQNPIDDDFLKRFRKPPRPEFARKLYDQLQSEDSMLAKTPYSMNGARPTIQPKSWDQRLTLAAALLALLLLGTIVVFSNLYRQTPRLTTNAPQIAGAPITAENAANLTLLSRMGEGYILSAAWSPDGSLLALNGSLGVWIYNPNDLSEPIALFALNDTAYMRTLKFTPDNSRLLVFTTNQIQVWDIAAQSIVGTPIDTGNIISFDVNPNGTLVAVGSYDGRMMVYDVETGEVKTEFTVTYAYTPIMDVSFSPDGTRIAFTGSQMPLLILDDPTGEWNNITAEPEVIRPPETSEAGITGISFSPDGTLLAARVYTSIYVWELETGMYMVFNPNPDPNAMIGKGGGGDLTFSPDGTRLATVDTAIRVWDFANNTYQTLFEGSSTNFIGFAAFSPDWSRLAIVDITGVLHLRDVQTGEDVATLDRYTVQGATDLEFSPDGTLASVGNDNFVRLWDVNQGTQQQGLQFEGLVSYGLQQIDYQPDGTLALMTQNGIYTLPSQGSEWVTLWRNTSAVQSIGFGTAMDYSPDGSLIAYISLDNSTVTLIDSQTGEVRQHFEMSDGSVARDLAFSPNGQHIAISTAQSPFGSIFGGGGGGGGSVDLTRAFPIHIMDIATGEVVTTLERPDEALVMTYTPDGTRLITYTPASLVRIWDIASQRIVAALEANNGVNSFALSPDGSLLVIGVYEQEGASMTLHLWDMNGDFSAPLAVIDDHDGTGVFAFNADGTLLAGASYNGTIKLWGVP
jgi:WD40 repeat protein